MLESFMWFSLLFSPEIDLAKARNYSANADYIKSEQILNSYNFKKKYATDYHYLKMVNAAFINDKKETIKYSQYLLDSFTEIPVRYYALAFALRNEAEGWKDNDMADISRNMKNSSVRLDNSYAGPETQKVQQKILDQLDKFIQDKEQELKDEQEKEAQAAKRKMEGKPKTGESPTPQDESHIGKDSGPGKVDAKKLQNLSQNWGKLPEKERAKAMMELTKDLPPRYREVIENYFRALAKGVK